MGIGINPRRFIPNLQTCVCTLPRTNGAVEVCLQRPFHSTCPHSHLYRALSLRQAANYPCAHSDARRDKKTNTHISTFCFSIKTEPYFHLNKTLLASFVVMSVTFHGKVKLESEFGAKSLLLATNMKHREKMRLTRRTPLSLLKGSKPPFVRKPWGRLAASCRLANR